MLKFLKSKCVRVFLTTAFTTILIDAIIATPVQSDIFDWANTELHYQYGNIDTPEFAGGGDEFTHIFTIQHADGWKYGDNFFFVDFLNDSKDDNFNDSDYYGELYSYFSFSKIFGRSFKFGPISDFGLVAGINIANDPKVIKYLPGFRLSWDVPGFAFFNTVFTAYLDRSSGIDSGGAPEENDSFMVDVSWAYPINIGRHSFSIEGHIEYIGERENEFGDRVSEWFLGQPQFRYDLGKTLFNRPNRLFIGAEWQFWINKLGDNNTHENTLQALVVLRY